MENHINSTLLKDVNEFVNSSTVDSNLMTLQTYEQSKETRCDNFYANEEHRSKECYDNQNFKYVDPCTSSFVDVGIASGYVHNPQLENSVNYSTMMSEDNMNNVHSYDNNQYHNQSICPTAARHEVLENENTIKRPKNQKASSKKRDKSKEIVSNVYEMNVVEFRYNRERDSHRVALDLVKNRRPFTCPFHNCGKSFRNIQTLRMHFKSHSHKHDAENAIKQLAHKLPVKKCDSLSRRGTNNNNLNATIDILLSSTTTKGASTAYPSVLNSYYGKASGKNKKIASQCPVCQQTFVGLYEMRRHFVRKHSEGKKNFACPNCSNRFYLESDLRDHEKMCRRTSKRAKCMKPEQISESQSDKNIESDLVHENRDIDEIQAVAGQTLSSPKIYMSLPRLAEDERVLSSSEELNFEEQMILNDSNFCISNSHLTLLQRGSEFQPMESNSPHLFHAPCIVNTAAQRIANSCHQTESDLLSEKNTVMDHLHSTDNQLNQALRFFNQ